MAAPLIEIKHLIKTYDDEGVNTTALNGVDFSVAKGEFVSIMGPSGSGKSTLLHMLGMLDRPTSGQYLFDGLDTAGLSDIELAHLRNERIGFVFQAFHLLARTTVLENVMLPLYYSNVPTREYRKRAETALEHVELTNRMHHKPSQLSGGERQRVAIARALVNDPQIIFADEPTGNLDSHSGAAVLQTIDGLHQQGHTIVVITHESPTAEYAQRIVTLRDGQIESNVPVTSRHSHYIK